MIAARSALTNLQDQLRDRQGPKVVGKTYAALVWGDWPEAEGHRRAPRQVCRRRRRALGAPWTKPTKRTPSAPSALVKVRSAPRLGHLARRHHQDRPHHQIRVHLQQAGHPIVGDPKYGDFERNRELARGPRKFDRMFLHARELRFTHPPLGPS